MTCTTGIAHTTTTVPTTAMATVYVGGFSTGSVALHPSDRYVGDSSSSKWSKAGL